VRYWAQGIPRPGQDVAQRAQQAQQQPQQPAAPPPAPVWTGTAPQPSPMPPRWNARTVENAVLKAMAENPQTPPPGLNWDLYLGPAPEIPYHPAYHPFAWRGWVDFGVGALGDMGAHLMDQAYWALDLGLPTTINASSSPWGGLPNAPATYPLATSVHYTFPARGRQPAVDMHWYDGGLLPPRPAMLPDKESLLLGDGGGGMLIGEKGMIAWETYGDRPRIFPESVAQAAAKVPKSLPRITGTHEANWVSAAKKEGPASSPFEYSARLTEVMLLGVAALRAGQGRQVHYDGAKMEFTNAPDANQYLTRVYRKGWEL
jgi:hypothetical protein